MSGSVFSGEQPSRPDLYAGSRRRFSGMGTIASGFVALVLVLGALLTSELDRYSSQDEEPPLHSQATGSARLPSAAAPAAPAVPLPTTAAPPAAGSASPTPTPTRTAVADAVNTSVLTTVNRALDDLGCAPVVIEPKLVSAARAHMDTMIATGYLTLTAPNGTGPDARAKAAGFRGTAVEAIVLGADAPAQAAKIGVPLPAAADDPLPVTVRVVAKEPLKCGYTSLGADFRRDTRNVPITAIVLGKK
ncbi:CAP domain-containing protein [Cryptosporangium aurantiacum]|uniref:Uncharacterized protein n=1 Tax=Cryptosporangium aurantiacum TaxID=134849 RepID=A0A1M7MHJ8_9ACTN|nr:hypothetical protein [Cryptosporangium aurantiacum]SHM90285.1 hypothetical protein SAMN05443668_102124 [Cryptosporangium aurantiacum]